jgi:hypothetical protein
MRRWGRRRCKGGIESGRGDALQVESFDGYLGVHGSEGNHVLVDQIIREYQRAGVKAASYKTNYYPWILQHREYDLSS